MPHSQDLDVIDFYEQIVDDAVTELVAVYEDVLQALGPRPFGWVEGDRWDQLERYLEVRDNPAAWQMLIGQWAQSIGQDAAEITAVREAILMEKRLRYYGPEVVDEQLMLRRLRRARPAIAEAQRLAALPPLEVAPPLPPRSILESLGTLVNEPAPPGEIYEAVEPEPIFPPFVEIGLSSSGESLGPVRAGPTGAAQAGGGVGEPVPPFPRV